MSELIFSKELKSTPTTIDGLVAYDLPVHGDNRGWFKENWQREKMTALGLPDFGPVQNNISFNTERGVTRGLHAEPWDKYISIGYGSVFGAWCDLREDSKTFGEVFTMELDPSKAIYVPRGVANGFQTLEDNTVYTYLVNDHWSPTAQYSNVSVSDQSLGINWPIALESVTLSEKDKSHPNLEDATPVKPRKILITGANGQLGRALQKLYPEADLVDRDTLDISSDEVFTARRWRDYGLVINAAAYTAVDAAETPEGRIESWKANSSAVSKLAKIAIENGLTLVHISSDYVFDGTQAVHTEEEPFSPLSVYGQSKASGDTVASTVPNHYILRTSWVMGQGNNFVKTMKSLADKGIKPSVVNDQIGRPTFTEDLAAGIKHLVDTGAEPGTYNLTNEGESTSWSDLAKLTYELNGHSADEVTGVATEEYYRGKDNIAPRPLNSTMDLTKIKSTGFEPRDWREALDEYWQTLKEEN